MNRKNIWQDIELELREEKKRSPNFPDHVCGQAGRVVEEAGSLMAAANDVKYRPAGSETLLNCQKTEMRKSAIRTAAAAIRFLENIK